MSGFKVWEPELFDGMYKKLHDFCESYILYIEIHADKLDTNWKKVLFIALYLIGNAFKLKCRLFERLESTDSTMHTVTLQMVCNALDANFIDYEWHITARNKLLKLKYKGSVD
jgi:hypothetical protein